MSKIYEKYLILKKKDKEKLYLFRSGNFYIFLDEDCDYINEYVVLKKTLFTKDIYKCGFPVNALDRYMHVFNNHNLNIELVEDYEVVDYDDDIKEEIFTAVKKVEIDNLTPLAALNFLSSLKEKINERS